MNLKNNMVFPATIILPSTTTTTTTTGQLPSPPATLTPPDLHSRPVDSPMSQPFSFRPHAPLGESHAPPPESHAPHAPPSLQGILPLHHHSTTLPQPASIVTSPITSNQQQLLVQLLSSMHNTSTISPNSHIVVPSYNAPDCSPPEHTHPHSPNTAFTQECTLLPSGQPGAEESTQAQQVHSPAGMLDGKFVTTGEQGSKLSYASLFVSHSLLSHSKFNDLPTPYFKGDIPAIKLDEETYQKALVKCKFNLIGRVILPKGAEPIKSATLNSKLSSIWNLKNAWTISPLWKGYYCLRFSDANDQHSAWIKFCLYARLLVDVDLQLNLPSKVLVERDGFSFEVNVSYEQLPDFYTHCSSVGHFVGDCRILKKMQEESNRANDSKSKQ
ncbi:hypothetical protein LguiA_036714 [Lonicera macranthoides]